MNKVVHINLGGSPFTMDEDAYDHLSAYLTALHRHFRGTEGYEEITADIEARLAELFRDNLGARPIVVLQDVKEVIAVMGTPEDFGAPEAEPGHTSSGKTEGEPLLRTGKRLFRDTDDKVAAGVCSGIAAYFGIADPVWVRLFFAITALSGGFGIPIYFVLWAVMPEAKTAGDRLAMRGEPINVSNISRVIQDELVHLSKKVTELSEEMNGKKNSEEYSQKFQQGAQAFAAAAGAGATALSKVVLVAAQVIIVGIILAFAMGWFAIIGGLIFSYPFLGFVFPGQETMTALASVSLLFVLGLPLVSLALTLSRMVFRTKVSLAWKIGLGVLWFASLTTLMSTGGRLATQFTAQSRTEQDLDLSALGEGPQQVQLAVYDALPHDHQQIFDGKLLINRQEVRWENVQLRIHRAEDGQWRLTERRYGRGESTANAEQHTQQVLGKAQIEAGRISLPGSSLIKMGQPWRAQELTYDLYVPDGGVVRFGEHCNDLISSVDLAEAHEGDFWENAGAEWRMQADGLALQQTSSNQ